MAQKSALNYMKEAKEIDVINHGAKKQECVAPGVYKMWSGANAVVKGTHLGSALYMARSVVNVGSKTISRQFASQHIGRSKTSGAGIQLGGGLMCCGAK